GSGQVSPAPGQNPPVSVDVPPIIGTGKGPASGWPIVPARLKVPPVLDVVPPPSTVNQSMSKTCAVVVRAPNNSRAKTRRAAPKRGVFLCEWVKLLFVCMGIPRGDIWRNWSLCNFMDLRSARADGDEVKLAVGERAVRILKHDARAT